MSSKKLFTDEFTLHKVMKPFSETLNVLCTNQAAKFSFCDKI